MSKEMLKQKSITNFFGKTSMNKKSIAEDHVKWILDELVKKCTDAKKHDGQKVQQKTIYLWKRRYRWLIVEVDDTGGKKLKCSICRDGKADNVWANDGTMNIQSSTIDRHNTAADHTKAERMLLRKIPDEYISTDELEKSSSSSSKTEDKVLFRTVYYAAYEELPTDKINSLLGLQNMHGIEISYKNLSWDTISDIQDCIADIMKRKVVTEIKKSSVYALMIDESTDISVQKKLSICVRYVVNGESKTQFLSNVKLDKGNAHAIVNALIAKLNVLDIDPGKLVSFATDGAATMMGHKTGVGVQMKSKYSPFMTQSHCMAHRLNLACNDAIKNIKPLQVLKDRFASLYFLISSSSSRTEKLKKMQEILNDPTLSIKEPYSVRWMGLRNAVSAVYECYPSVLATLSTLAAEKNATALGLYKYFSNYKISLMVPFMLDIHNVLAVLSSQLQRQQIMFSEIQPLMEGTISKLETLAYTDGESLLDMKANYEQRENEVFLKEEKLSNFGTEAEKQFKNLRENYISNLKENIQKRFSKESSDIFKNLSLILEPQRVNDANEGQCEEALASIASFYGADRTVIRLESPTTSVEQQPDQKQEVIPHLIDGKKLKQEWPLLKGMIRGSYRSINTEILCKKVICLHSELLPNFAVLCHIALCISVTSVECERSFSYQNRIKNKFRASLGPEKLDLLMTMHNGPPVDMYVPDEAIRLWYAKKARRSSRLTQPFKPRKK